MSARVHLSRILAINWYGYRRFIDVSGLTLITGAVFSETIFQQAMKFNHKTLFAIISWLIFAALLTGRLRYGWRGRKALRWTLSGFSALLLAYVGSRFVLEVILSRPLT